MFAIDLDELDPLNRKLRFFSVDRANVYALRQRDFFPTDQPIHPRVHEAQLEVAAKPAASSLKSRVVAYLAEHGIDLTGGRVMLITLPRVFGYLFNPVSFYFCFDRCGVPVAAIAEVTNTFREMKPFVLGPNTRLEKSSGTGFSLRVPKYFYVSPFTDMDVSFDFMLHTPGEKLSVQIDDYEAGQRTLTSVLTGQQRPLSDARLVWYSVKYPMITLRIITLIHWHALLLYLKKIPWFAKAARPEAQRDLYRPHISIAHPPKA